MYFVFTKVGCGVCKSVVNQLKSRGVQFEEIDVGTEEGWKKAQSLNIMSAGVIIDENNKVIKLADIK